MKNAKWFWGGIGLQLGVGYSVGCLVFQFGTWFTTGSVGEGFVPGMLVIAVFALILVALIGNTNRKLALEKAAKQRK